MDVVIPVLVNNVLNVRRDKAIQKIEFCHRLEGFGSSTQPYKLCDSERD